MTTQHSLNRQLKSLRLRFKFFGRSESRELQRILNPEEQIMECAYGFYQGGSGLLVATDQRLLLVDKRPFYLNLEEIDYREINKLSFTPSWVQASIYVKAGMRVLHFKSFSDARLRRLNEYIERRNAVSEQLSIGEVHERISPKKPYLDPRWRPHHTTMGLRVRRRPTKFYPLKSMVSIGNNDTST